MVTKKNAQLTCHKTNTLINSELQKFALRNIVQNCAQAVPSLNTRTIKNKVLLPQYSPFVIGLIIPVG